MNPAPQQNKIYIYQFTRALACILVCLGHLTRIGQFTTGKFMPLVSIEQLGVAFFFFISGFLITKSLESETIQSFAIRRMFRIYPVMLTIFGIALLLWYMTGYLVRGDSPEHIDLVRYLTNLLFITDVTGVEPLISNYWTLVIEVKFYILAAVVFALHKKTKINILILFPLILCALMFILSGVYITGNFNHLQGVIIDFSNYLHLFCGVIFYAYTQKRITCKQTIIMIAATLIAAFHIGILCDYSRKLIEAFSYMIGIPLAITIIMMGQNKLRESRIMNFFANISYPLYLLHYNLGCLSFNGWCNKLGILQPFSMSNDLDRILFFFIISVPLSYVIHLYIEKPAINLSKRLGSKSI